MNGTIEIHEPSGLGRRARPAPGTAPVGPCGRPTRLAAATRTPDRGERAARPASTAAHAAGTVRRHVELRIEPASGSPATPPR
ncbi:hypothetical protein [Streptomyces sp. NPDC003952]